MTDCPASLRKVMPGAGDGDQPATNSLEGCDSTIELLPPKPFEFYPQSTPKIFLEIVLNQRRGQLELAEGLEPPTV